MPKASQEDAPRPVTFPIVAIGASAGGMEAFLELLRHVPAGSGLALVLIQHLDPKHASYLSEVLQRSTTLPVLEIEDGMRVERDHVYVVPSHADAGLHDDTLVLHSRSPDTRRPHLSIDAFFESLAAARANQAIAVVLSGTGADGAEGVRAIKASGGITFAQEPGSARFDGMPAAAIATGAVDFVLPIPALAEELLRVAHHPFVQAPAAAVPVSEDDETAVGKVLGLLRDLAQIDFAEYKLTSVRRRLARRMAVHRLTTMSAYARMLEDNPAEIKALAEDVLIHVTSLFRDGETFERLKEHVFPAILKRRRQGGTIRMWCAGCSTGEEAYSLVIAVLEFLAGEHANDVPIQMFATDISERAIEVARAGVYSDATVRDVAPDRLARYFTALEGGGYRINKAVRERCAFVKHDLARDPPFSRLDLVSCRNVLIYFGQDLQKRVLSTFHFALEQPGFLLLGRAENITEAGGLFSPVDKEARIFARTGGKRVLQLGPPRDVTRPVAPAAASDARSSLESSVRRAEIRLLDHYAPPGVIVNDRMEILRYRGRTGAFLEPPSGEPRHDLLKMARGGLVAELRIAIGQAKKDLATVRRSNVRVDQNGSRLTCDVVVIPIATAPEASEHLFAVLFEERSASTPEAPSPEPGVPEPDVPASAAEPLAAGAAHVATLEDELAATREYLQSIIDEHRRTNDELMSANEEMLSTNEELQSLNEELETAKEELQSTNEELSTLNEELQSRNHELDSLNGDLINILGSVDIPIVIVDGQRRIRRFTPKARPILNLLPSDVGRPIDDIRPTIEIGALDHKIAQVIETVVPYEEEVRGRDGTWYRLHIRPYTTVDKKIDGAVLSVIDIDVLKRALGAAEWARDYARATVEAVQTPLVVLGERQVIVSANQAFYEHYRRHPADIEGRSLYQVLGGGLDVPALREALATVGSAGPRFQLELDREIPQLGPRTLSVSGGGVHTQSGERLTLLAVDDITERHLAEAERERLLAEAKLAKASAEEANRTKDLFLATLSHELRTPLSTLLMQAQLLLHTPFDEARVRRSGETIERAAKAQAQLIDDLLDISRIVTGKLPMELQPVDVTAIVRAALDTVAPSLEQKQHELVLELGEALPAVAGDPMRLQQVIWNLLANAIKFTPARGRVTVSADELDGRVRVRVSDTGIGIASEFVPHVFNRFSQEDRGHTRAYGGLGLGLGIARYIVEAHGGTIEVSSAGKGAGASFTVLLPAIAARPKAEASVASGPGAAGDGRIRGARILVVEDDPDTRDSLAEVLALAGAEVRTAGSATEAITRLDERAPDLLVCDIAMPDQDGYWLLERIRSRDSAHGGGVPAIALTALASTDDRERALEVGFQAHVAKPVDVDRLVAEMSRLLGRAT
jgi:two-component system, chemotaxis family, CheB/CheR fusion protein